MAALGLAMIGLFVCVFAAAMSSGVLRESGGSEDALTAAAYNRLAGEIDANLRSEVLAKWFPSAVDTQRGGFHQNFREDWSGDPREDRSLVYQARLTWVAAQIALRYPAEAAVYKKHAAH